MMSDNIKKFIILNFVFLCSAFGILPQSFALAATVFNGTLPTAPVTSIGGLANFVCMIAGWFFVFFIVISVVLIILAAYSFLLAGAGDSSRSSDSRQYVWYALISFVVAVMARGVPLIVTSFVGGTGVQSC